MSFNNGSVRIKVKTWKRDSYGLYDYETTNYHSQNLDICRSGKLIRSNNELNYMLPSLIQDSDDSISEDITSSHEVLADISEGPEGIKIVPNTIKSNENNQMWLSLDKNEGGQGHLLKENDTIKLGRVVFKIKQIKFPQHNTQVSEEMLLKSLKEYMEEDRKLVTVTQNDENTSNACCKICLGDRVEKDDPLISPCKCIGSVKFVHLKCLQNWVKSKLNMEEEYKIITIFWQLLNCELCKSKLPLCINHQGADFLLLPFETKFTGPYIILESFSKEKDPAGIHIIDLSDKETFKIGRGHDCDLKLSDISVSRIHSVLNIDQGKLYLKDNYSKFGTLILLEDPITLDDKNYRSAWIQCGKTVLRFSLKRPWNTMIPCLPLFPKNKVPSLKPDRVLDEKKDEKPQRETRDEL